MIGYWHEVPAPHGNATIALGAHLGGHELVVEHLEGEACWHWSLMSALGHELEAGEASDAHRAELAAEEAAFHIHPPCEGDWVARLLV